MTATASTISLLRRLPAFAALAAALIGVPLALWRLGGRFLPDTLPSWAQITTALGRPDTGAVFLGLLVVIGWAAWAMFTLAVAAELAAQLRGRPPLRLPGLRAPQQLAGLLVAAVLGVTAPPLLSPPALAASPVVAERPIDHPTSAPVPLPGNQPAGPGAAGPTYTVQPRDTLGRIAARYLGDWTRFEEILDLNRGRLQQDGGALTDPGLIRPGWVLVLPPDAILAGEGRTGGQEVVQPGDTLSDIARAHGLESWQQIFDLNAGEPLPGGGRFTDPDLIRPGQLLDLPAVPARPTANPRPSPEETPAPPTPPGEPGTPVPPPTPTGTPAPSVPPDQPVPAPATHTTGPAAGDRTPEGDGSSELAAVLAGSSLLAAGLGTVWVAHRRQRLRRRRPGRRLAPAPAEQAATQATTWRTLSASMPSQSG